MTKKKEYAVKGRNPAHLYLQDKDLGVDCKEYFETRKYRYSVLYDAYNKIVRVPSSSTAAEKLFSI